MKKVLALGLLACLSTSAMATLGMNDSLSQRCHKAAVKLDKISSQQTDGECAIDTSGWYIERAGEAIFNGNLQRAKTRLTTATENLRYAQHIGCKGQDIISWSITEADSIKLAIK